MALETLGKYQLQGILGRGAAGTVYDARDPVIGRRVAIKTVKLPNADDPETLEELGRFRREAQAAGGMSHPNIVPIFDYGETDEIAYIVMEYVGGGTLKGLLKDNKQLPPGEALRVMEQVLAGLQYSHDRGIVHRDIKPDNVMLTSDNTVKIADFGIARIEGSGHTMVGTMLGTPAYMSPEQWRGDPNIDARSDIYAAGVMLYHLLTGRRPFEGGNQSAIMHAVLSAEPEPPSEVSVSAPPELDAVVLKAIAKRPEDRFQSAAAFAAALKDAVARIGAGADADRTMVQPARRPAAQPPRSAAAEPAKPAAPATKPAGSKLGLVIAAVAGVLVIGGGGAGAWWWLRGTGTDERVALLNPATPPVANPPVVNPPVTTPPVTTPPVTTPPVTTPAAVPARPDPAADQAARAAADQAAARAAADQAAAQAAADRAAAAKAAADQAAAKAAADQVAARLAADQAAAKLAADQAAAKAAADQAAAKAAADQAAAARTAADQAAAKAAADQAAAAKEEAARKSAEQLALLNRPVTPPPQPIPPPQPAVPSIREVLATMPCAAVYGEATPASLSLRGVVPQDNYATLRFNFDSLVAQTRRWDVLPIPGLRIYCQVIDTLRPVLRGLGEQKGVAARLLPAPGSSSLPLQTDDPIDFAIEGPDFPSVLQVDYIGSDGKISHYMPRKATPALQARRLKANERVRLFDNYTGAVFTVYPPYGTDLVVVIASSEPLQMARTVDDDDNVASYTAALRNALEAARRRNVRVSVDLVPVESVEKPGKI